jgi:3-oxoacyl-[acyl-carrier protein] reductase
MTTRRVIVTGGGTGLGKAIARAFLDEAPDLVLVGRRQSRLDAAADELSAEGGGATVSTYSCDLRDPEAVQRLADSLRAGPRVDALVLNAGGTFGADGDDLAAVAADWRADFDGNVLTTVLITEALLDHLTRPGARIVAMSSVAGLRGASSYGAAKAAVNGWTWWMSGRLAADGITVNAVAPGFVPDTEFWTDRLAADPGLAASRTAGIPVGRPGTPAEVAAAVQHLASPEAGWTTGQILGVNGGVVLGR